MSMQVYLKENTLYTHLLNLKDLIVCSSNETDEKKKLIKVLHDKRCGLLSVSHLVSVIKGERKWKASTRAAVLMNQVKKPSFLTPHYYYFFFVVLALPCELTDIEYVFF